MKKFISFIILLLTLIMLPSCAFAYGYHGWHRGPRIIIAPPIIVRPPLHCEYYPHVIRFVNYNDAVQWVNVNNYWIYNPTLHIMPTYTEVNYFEQYCY